MKKIKKEIIAQDLLGADVKSGDIVVFKAPRYSNLLVGVVIKVAAKTAKILYRDNYGHTNESNIRLEQVVKRDTSLVITQNVIDALGLYTGMGL